MQFLESPIIDVSWLDLTAALGLVLIATGISRWQRTGLEGSFVIGALRTLLQLALVGYVLVYIFSIDRWWLVMLALLVMLAVSSVEAVNLQ